MRLTKLALVLCTGIIMCAKPNAAVPELINFQGLLTDTTGNPMTDSAYSVTFAIYDAAAGGTILWSETQSITTSSGLFTVLLGSANPVPDSVFNNPDRWLGFQIPPHPEMTPRTQLVSQSYAFRVNSVDGAMGGTISGDLSVTGKLGIGTISPAQNLDVAGTAQMTGFKMPTNAAAGYVLTSDIGGNGTWQAPGTANNWSLTGNAGTVPGTNFLGTTDNQALVLYVNNNHALHFEPTISTTNLIGGSALNNVTNGASGATISGGGLPTLPNRVTDHSGTVSGGVGNRAGDDAGTVNDKELATVGGGAFNVASGGYSTVGGGSDDTASGVFAVVAGGRLNRSRGNSSVVGGGYQNDANANRSVIAGGELNLAAGIASVVSGGSFNRARGVNSVVAGGGSNSNPADSNAALGDYSTVSGGRGNIANNSAATVAGGQFNTASFSQATVGGGRSNQAINGTATIAGGSFNTASGVISFIGGGNNNVASAQGSAVGGGEQDTAGGNYSTVPGGYGNKAAHEYTLAAGRRAKALHFGSFVWADATDADFASTANNQFLIRAAGGVGIGTTAPSAKLHVKGAGFPHSFGFFDTDASGQDAGLRFYEAGAVKSHIFHSAFDRTLNIFTEPAYSGISIDTGGSVGIGTSAPAARLHVNGNAGNNTGVWSNLSDRRLKKDIEPISNALQTVEMLEGVTFRWNDSDKDFQFGRVRGLIAQDVEKVIPEWIITDPDGYKRLEPIGIDALLIEAIKELKAENEELKDRISKLEKAQPRAHTVNQ
jgi:hypothetical protein